MLRFVFKEINQDKKDAFMKECKLGTSYLELVRAYISMGVESIYFPEHELNWAVMMKKLNNFKRIKFTSNPRYQLNTVFVYSISWGVCLGVALGVMFVVFCMEFRG